jgi:tRNA pseudouridine55 synthase
MLNGFLVVRKPRGPTSHDVVERVRRALNARAGHAGTLDPAAEGVLVLGLGEARKFIRWLQDDKVYEAELRLGQESDTLDLEGVLTAPRPVAATPAEIRAAGEALRGDVTLPVPAYSAVKVGGRRLHEAARAGDVVEAPLRTFRVDALDVLAVEPPLVRFRVACAAGTYVRSLAAEWGRRLGCGALLTVLVRTRAGMFRIEDAASPETFDGAGGAAAAAARLVPLDTALAHLPAAALEADAERRLRQGQRVRAPAGLPDGDGVPVRLAPAGGGPLIGIGLTCAGPDGARALKAERMLALPAAAAAGPA